MINLFYHWIYSWSSVKILIALESFKNILNTRGSDPIEKIMKKVQRTLTKKYRKEQRRDQKIEWNFICRLVINNNWERAIKSNQKNIRCRETSICGRGLWGDLAFLWSTHIEGLFYTLRKKIIFASDEKLGERSWGSCKNVW